MVSTLVDLSLRSVLIKLFNIQSNALSVGYRFLLLLIGRRYYFVSIEMIQNECRPPLLLNPSSILSPIYVNCS